MPICLIFTRRGKNANRKNTNRLKKKERNRNAYNENMKTNTEVRFLSQQITTVTDFKFLVLYIDYC